MPVIGCDSEELQPITCCPATHSQPIRGGCMLGKNCVWNAAAVVNRALTFEQGRRLTDGALTSWSCCTARICCAAAGPLKLQSAAAMHKLTGCNVPRTPGGVVSKLCVGVSNSDGPTDDIRNISTSGNCWTGPALFNSCWTSAEAFVASTAG